MIYDKFRAKSIPSCLKQSGVIINNWKANLNSLIFVNMSHSFECDWNLTIGLDWEVEHEQSLHCLRSQVIFPFVGQLTIVKDKSV